MPGYIDSTSDQALYEGYSQGRAFSGATMDGVSPFAQWSAVNDSKTCDFCGWADDRIFNTTVEPYDPPVHFGCRCIIAFIKINEFTPEADWGKGPPASSFPPGRTNGKKRGKPTQRQKGKTSKSPLRERASAAAERWRQFFKSQFRLDQKSGGFFGDAASLDQWHFNSLESILGSDYSLKARLTLDDFLNQWTATAPRAMKEFGEAMARGTVSDILKAQQNWEKLSRATMPERIRAMSATDVEAFLKMWQAHKELTVEVLKQTGWVSADNTITVFRGVRAASEKSLQVKNSLAAGDLEQAIGTNFIESWSTNINAAVSFAGPEGMIFEKAVEVEQFFMSWAEHSSFLRFGPEKEMLWYNWDGTLVPKKVTKLTGSRAGKLQVEVW